MRMFVSVVVDGSTVCVRAQVGGIRRVRKPTKVSGAPFGLFHRQDLLQRAVGKVAPPLAFVGEYHRVLQGLDHRKPLCLR